MTKMIRRETAAKYARGAQAACVALAVLAVAVASLGIPGSGKPPAELAQLPEPSADAAKRAKLSAVPGPASEGVNFDAIGQRLAMIDNAPKPPEPEKVEPTEHPTETPVAAEPGVKFLGAIIEPTRRVALVSVNGKQRALAPGQIVHLGPDESAGTLKIVSVEDGFVTVEDKQGSRRIDKAARTSPAVTLVSATNVAGSEPPRPPDQQPAAMSAAVKALRDLRATQKGNPEALEKLREIRRALGDSAQPRNGRREGGE